MKSGAMLIADERRRQYEKEGYTDRHDDELTCGELALAAACYAAYVSGEPIFRKVVNDWKDRISFCFLDPWPFDEEFDKRMPRDEYGEYTGEPPTREHKIRTLAKAGAFIAAEIDRLNRTAD